jgi:hypothetical protein
MERVLWSCGSLAVRTLTPEREGNVPAGIVRAGK